MISGLNKCQSCRAFTWNRDLHAVCSTIMDSVNFLVIEPAHKLKIDQNKLQNCRSNILNLVNVL
ncbi:hypothetical protein D1AOALGA4SA_4652 [Olavius algarvensis Delta 1 endosymbiont]|nr:hypothetical protein D1AOALGA4SA_4652 [Olavius algarvensis Delta 1 endosymbiont]